MQKEEGGGEISEKKGDELERREIHNTPSNYKKTTESRLRSELIH